MSEQARSADFTKELAQIALSMQSERTGHMPKAVTVVASDETVVLTLHEALTPAEKLLARSESGAAKVEQYHRALFAVSCDELRKEIQRLTGRRVREAAVVVEPATGAIVHAFTSGTVVQIFQLEPHGVVTHVAAGVPKEPGDVPG
ncbi:MAG: Na-translocating system protein MpsC family protein [Planctomycetia bacterium]